MRYAPSTLGGGKVLLSIQLQWKWKKPLIRHSLDGILFIPVFEDLSLPAQSHPFALVLSIKEFSLVDDFISRLFRWKWIYLRWIDLLESEEREAASPIKWGVPNKSRTKKS